MRHCKRVCVCVFVRKCILASGLVVCEVCAFGCAFVCLWEICACSESSVHDPALVALMLLVFSGLERGAAVIWELTAATHRSGAVLQTGIHTNTHLYYCTC